MMIKRRDGLRHCLCCWLSSAAKCQDRIRKEEGKTRPMETKSYQFVRYCWGSSIGAELLEAVPKIQTG